MIKRLLTAWCLLIGVLWLAEQPQAFWHTVSQTVISSGGVATVTTATLDANDSGDVGTSARTVSASSLTNTNRGQVRFTFNGSTANTSGCTHSSFGLSTGTGTNTTAAPTEILWSGVSGPSLTTSQVLVSDWITSGLSWNTSTDKLVIICDIDSTGRARFTTSAATGWAVTIAVCGALLGVTYNVADVSGTCGNSTSANWAYFVSLIETQ